MSGADCEWQRGNRAAAYLNFLYDLDGRHDKAHPMHGLYTGLWQARARQLIEHDREAVTRGQQA